MLSPIPQGIAENVVFLLAVALVYDLATSKRTVHGQPIRQVAVGLLLGLVAVGTMVTSLRLEPGIIFDARSVVLAVTGLFFGLAATLPAMAVAAAYRASEGGPGMWTGIWVILASGLVGLAWRQVRGHRLASTGLGELYLFGIAVHVVVLALMLTLPGDQVWEVLPVIGLPILVLYPLATAALGLLLVRRLDRDVTTRSLAESESRYRSLFEDSLLAMLIICPDDDRIVDANPAAARFYGYDRSEMRGMNLERISTLSADERSEVLARARRDTLERAHFRQRMADGSLRKVEMHGGPISLDGRDRIYVALHDVTDRTEAEAAIRRQAQDLRIQNAALEAAANPMVLTDRDGVIQWVNPAFSRLTGYSAEEAVGSNPGELVNSGVHDEAFFREMWRTILAGEVWDGEITNRRKDGTLYREHQTVTPVRNAEGEITHFIAVKQDLTEHLHLQSQLMQAQKMEAVGQLAGGVAHDFNNLLTVVSGSVQLARADVPPDSPLHERLQEIQDAGERAASLTRQLLTFSRRGMVARTTLELNELIEETAQLLERLLRDDIDLELKLTPDPTPIDADPSRIEQILMNLSINARDAMPSGGRLTLQTWIEEREPASEAARGDPHPTPFDMVVLQVTDTGEGMPAEVRERAFEPFYTTKPQGEGTGLGLATVYGIVAQAGGSIALESEPGEGTTFRIRLPRSAPSSPEGGEEPPGRREESAKQWDEAEGEATAKQGEVKRAAVAYAQVRGNERTPVPTRVEHTPVTSARVLLVDDEDAIRRVAERILEDAGHTVLSASSPRRALELLERHSGRLDLLVADVTMPELTGPELVEKVRRHHPGIQVLFTSGHAREALVARGVLADHQPFLAKPYTVKGLQARVRDVLEI